MKQIITEEEYNNLDSLHKHDFVRTPQHRPRLTLTGYINPFDWEDGLPGGIHFLDDYEVRILYIEK